MQLLFLLLLLIGPFVVMTTLSYVSPYFNIKSSTRARVGLSLFFAFTGIGHFIRTEAMAAMLPPTVPYRVELIYITGVLELLGAIGVWIPRLMKFVGVCLILMLIAVLPANIYSAFNRVAFGGHESGPGYLLVRVPFQVLVIAWTYFATKQSWLPTKRIDTT